MIARLARVRREYLGVNRRNHDYLFRYNPRERFAVADDKQATKAALVRAGVPTPGLVAVATAVWQVAGLRARLDGHGGFALKPAHGAGGGGILVIARRDGERFTKASGAVVGWEAVAAHAADVIGGGFSSGGRGGVLLVEDLVTSEATLAALSYRGVPDVRVLVFRGVPVLAMLRVATRRSDGRANLHLGGLGIGVALDSGRTTWGVHRGRPVDRHPDLAVPVAGHVVPCWDAVLLAATQAAEAAGLGYLGVDVVLDARRGPLVLEINARPGLGIQIASRQGLRPLLAAVAEAQVPAAVVARVAFGREVAARGGS